MEWFSLWLPPVSQFVVPISLAGVAGLSSAGLREHWRIITAVRSETAVTRNASSGSAAVVTAAVLAASSRTTAVDFV